MRGAGLACPPLKKPCRNKSVSSFSVKHRNTYFLVSSALGLLPPFKTTGSIPCPHPVNTCIPFPSELYLLSPESLGTSGGISYFVGVILPSAALWSSLPSRQPQSYLNTPVHPGTNVTQSTPLSSIAFFFFFLTKVTPGGSLVKNLPANAGNAGLIPGSGRSPGEGNGNPLQYSCLGNPVDRGAVHGAAESDVT